MEEYGWVEVMPNQRSLLPNDAVSAHCRSVPHPTQWIVPASSIMNVRTVDRAQFPTSLELERRARAVVERNRDRMEWVTLPHRTSVSGAEMYAVRIGKGAVAAKGVVVVAGVHAREVVNPEAVVLWLETVDMTKMRIDVELWVVFNANPEGRNRVVEQGLWGWRKNGRSVDLNRNYPFVWGTVGTSRVVSSDVYCGPSPSSENETQNLIHLQSLFRKGGCCFVDLHQFGNMILHSWGHAPQQSSNPGMNFKNSRFPLPRYREYMPSVQASRIRRFAIDMASAIQKSTGSRFGVMPAVSLYPTSGCGDDHCQSLSWANLGFTIEVGTSFLPQSPAEKDLWVANVAAVMNWVSERTQVF